MMDKNETNHMVEAIKWASGCSPVKESIPKVGAIIVSAENMVIGRGRRGSGIEGDDDHAEMEALRKVDERDLPKLAGSTLYTTLEPCTGEVRSNPQTCCTELIKQHQIKRVFVGILDPNQGVTGKGLLRLQEAGIEVGLFTPDLAKEIKIQNAAFIRTQQTLGAEILSPSKGEKLRISEDGGSHAIRFKCLNPPGTDTYLLEHKGGLCWPQPGPFRQVATGIYEIDAHFGTAGEFGLQLVTANELGSILVRYYRKIVELSRDLRTRLRDKADLSMLGTAHLGIEMNGPSKGFRPEASVNVSVAFKINLLSAVADRQSGSVGNPINIKYEIESSQTVPEGIWLGAAIVDSTGKRFANQQQDKTISVTSGKHEYTRQLTVSADVPLGQQTLSVNVWRGPVNGPSKWLQGKSLPITITK
jgi:pyrimidine deaminase RibD-like protein